MLTGAPGENPDPVTVIGMPPSESRLAHDRSVDTPDPRLTGPTRSEDNDGVAEAETVLGAGFSGNPVLVGPAAEIRCSNTPA
jgi:hypothetical protein